MFLRPVTLVCCCLVSSLTIVAQAAPTTIETLDMWSGQVNDIALRKLAPSTGFITDPTHWQKLCKTWQPDVKVPGVDFGKQLVLVGTVPGPNRVIMRPAVDEKGNVTFLVAGTKRGGPGFGYKLILISRQGVKTIKGQSIAGKGVRGTVLIPGKVRSFQKHMLEIKLWEYDPFLADVGAKLIDRFQVEKYQHQDGQETTTPFTVGAKLEPRKNRRYYITVFVLKNGKRTHIGEKDGKSGLCNVLTNGNPATVKIIARPVR